jgi:hypothetical protein
MSQENPTQEQIQKDNKKKLLLGGLLVTLVGVLYYQFFSGSGASNPQAGAAEAAGAAGVAKVAVKPTPSPTPQRQTSGTPVPIISQPLDLASIDQGNRSNGGTGRNIFIYPTPTPPPPPPTPTPAPIPTPWPIPVYSVNPGNVIARTAAFTLTVFGEKMPQDAQGLINGRAYPTTFVNAAQVKISVPAEAIRSVGVLSVTVQSSGNTSLISNPMPVNIAAPPEPPYKYVGLITIKNVPTAVLIDPGKDKDDDVFKAKKGEIIERKWKIINITPQMVEIEDTTIKVSHIINYTVDAR